MSTATRYKDLEAADRRLYRCGGCGAWRYRLRYMERSTPPHFCRRARP